MTDAAVYPTTRSKAWTGVGQGKSGLSGVQLAITLTEGLIGYLEWSYAGSEDEQVQSVIVKISYSETRLRAARRAISHRSMLWRALRLDIWVDVCGLAESRTL